jgi:UDP-N-acetylmuramyl pentapeptide synthase
VVATLPLPGDGSPKGIARRRRLKNGRMFAIAAAYGLGVSVEKIAEGIAQFPEVN